MLGAMPLVMDYDARSTVTVTVSPIIGVFLRVRIGIRAPYDQRLFLHLTGLTALPGPLS